MHPHLRSARTGALLLSYIPGMVETVTQPDRPEAAEGGGPDPHTRSQVRSVFETGPVPDRFSFHVASTRFFSRCGAQESNLSGPACRAGALPESEPREAEISGEQGLAVGSLSRQIYSLLITHELAAHPVERRGFAPRSLPREGRVLLLDDRPENGTGYEKRDGRLAETGRFERHTRGYAPVSGRARHRCRFSSP